MKEVSNDNSIKAIVVRVNSPGGSSMASDVIAKEIKLAKKNKPVIFSYGNVAASGGYYISCVGDSTNDSIVLLSTPSTLYLVNAI